MKPKRKVSGNLGRTQHFRADDLYVQIKEAEGPTRPCPFYGGGAYKDFNQNSHNLLNPNFPNPNVPIEQFDFLKTKNGSWSLQAYCKVCYKAYRQARIKRSRSTWFTKKGASMSDAQVYVWYRKNVGLTAPCSVCGKNLSPEMFRLSPGMEKGIHNICRACEVGASSSVREQAWLADGNWASRIEAALKLHRSKDVLCNGWSPSVKSGQCLKRGIGKDMHADHIVPLRAGGIHDARNLQALCSICNLKKSDQIDPEFDKGKIGALVGACYQGSYDESDSIQTIERKLKNALVVRLDTLVINKTYLIEIQKKKREVNGQWLPERTFKKGTEWLENLKKGRKQDIDTI